MKHSLRKLLYSGLIAAALITPAKAQLYGFLNPVNPTNPTGTTSLTGVAMGLGVTGAGGGCFLQVQKTGVVLFIITYTGSNNTAGDGFSAQIVYGTQATAPANGAAIPASWTSLGPVLTGASNGGTVQENSTLTFIGRGLPLNTLMAFDLKFAAQTAGTASATNVVCQAMEMAN